MRIPRVYVDKDLQPGATVALPAAAAHHLSRVLRLREGDPVVLFNGRGGEFAGKLDGVHGAEAQVAGLVFSPVERESPLHLVLAQGISRGERMDYTLQKAVELGIAEIVPIWTERTTVRSDPGRDEKRRAHWQGVAISACEQCGRNRVPVIHNHMNLLEFFKFVAAGVRLLLHGEGTTRLRDIADAEMQQQGRIILLAGPEGGFTPNEVNAVTGAGFRAVRLGPRTLRTETAALAALAAIQTLWGDFA